MTPETEKYFRDLNDMFRSEGWKILLGDIQASAIGVNSIENTKDEQDLYYRKGQLAVMNNILNLETQVSAAQEQAEESTMLKIRDFQCPDGHTKEYFVSDDVVLTRCECGKDAKRVISPIRSVLEPHSGDFAGATMKWARDRERKIKQERKANS
jgi:hypothetical protein